jgi:hypothetical protein
MTKKYYILLYLCIFTLCHAESTFFSYFDSVSSLFNRYQEKIISQEFTNAQALCITNKDGAITVHTWQQNSIMVEICIHAKNTDDVVCSLQNKEGTVYLETKYALEDMHAEVNYNIIIPENTDVTLKTESGNILVKQARGILQAKTGKGNIEMYGVQNNANAKVEEKGDIIIESVIVPEETVIQAFTHKGNITVKTSQTTQALIAAKTEQGKINSELLITLHAKTTKLSSEIWNQLKKEIHGYINDSEAKSSINLKTNNGNINFFPLHD